MTNVVNMTLKKEDPIYPIRITFTNGTSHEFHNHNIGESEDLSGFIVVVNKDTDDVEHFFNKESVIGITVMYEEEKDDNLS